MRSDVDRAFVWFTTDELQYDFIFLIHHITTALVISAGKVISGAEGF